MNYLSKSGVRRVVSIAALGATALPLLAYAHVVVRPKEAGIASYQTFTASVPSEKDSATVLVRLAIPEGIESVTPTVKPGWAVRIIRDGEGETARVTDLVWEHGKIPPHFRDEFTFSAKMPAEVRTLTWKAYQRYENGDVVSWENPPMMEQPKKSDGSPDFSTMGPYSETKVIDDLAPPAAPENWAGNIAIASFLLSVVAIALSFMRRH